MKGRSGFPGVFRLKRKSRGRARSGAEPGLGRAGLGRAGLGRAGLGKRLGKRAWASAWASGPGASGPRAPRAYAISLGAGGSLRLSSRVPQRSFLPQTSHTPVVRGRFVWRIQALRWIQCTGIHRIRRGARIHRGNRRTLVIFVAYVRIWCARYLIWYPNAALGCGAPLQKVPIPLQEVTIIGWPAGLGRGHGRLGRWGCLPGQRWWRGCGAGRRETGAQGSCRRAP